jgi:hypothetical protein
VKHKTTISAEELKSVLTYDELSGIFTWKKKIGRRSVIGAEAGTVGDRGYIRIGINKTVYKAHKLAWFYVHEKWPDRIDHRDLNPKNNSLDNLRLCTQSQNGANNKISKRNTSGYKGVSFHKPSGKWRAVIGYRKEKISLGLFYSKEDAAGAYTSAADRLFGEFARS